MAENKSFKSYRKLILCILILLFAGIYALQLVFTGKSKQETLTLKESPDSLLITSPANGQIKLQKENDSWFIGEQKYPADSDVVQRLLDSIVNMKTLGTASSSSQDEESRYGLVQGQAVEVEAYLENKLLRKIKIGKSTATGGQTYIQLDSKPQVYLLGESLDGLFTKSVDELRNKAVYDLGQGNIISVNLDDGSSELSLEKDFSAVDSSDGETESGVNWKLLSSNSGVKQESLDKDKITAWVNGLAFLRVSKWMEDNYALPKELLPSNTIELKTADGKSVILQAYLTKAEEKTTDENGEEKTVPAEYVFKASLSPYYFTLSASSQGKLLKAISELTK